MSSRRFAAIAVLLLSTAGVPAQATVPQPLALVGANVHVGDGSAPQPDAVVVVVGERIAAVGARAAVAVPEGARVVDLAGRHLAPGLIDTHVHYSQTGWVDGRPDAGDVREQFPYAAAIAANEAHPERYHLAFLHAGVTAVFDCGGYPWTRRLGAATEHDALAPHVAAAGPLLATYDPKVLTLPDQQQFMFPQTEAEARQFVRSHHAFGSAAIKVWYIETPDRGVDLLSPIVHAAGDEAHALGLPLIVHATTLATARDAVEAGAHLLVHSVEDQPVDDAFVAAAVAAGTFYCPTLTVRDGYLQVYRAEVGDAVRAQLDDVHPSVAERVRRTEGLRPRARAALDGMARRFELQRATMAANLLRLHEAGVPVVLGTDAGNPLTLHGPSVWPELEAMAAAGLSPAAVLTAATASAARAMGRGADLGRIAAGCIADLVVLEGDPEADVRAWRSVRQVVRAGVLHEPAALLPRGP